MPPPPPDRARTGIEGFDELCGGGLLRGRSYLVSGTSGAGKTIFSLQYLIAGATQFNEPGLLLATEEPPRQLREDAARFGWELDKLEGEGKLALIDASSAKLGIPSLERVVDERPFDSEHLMDQLVTLQEQTGARRAVVDSVTALGYGIPDINERRLTLLKLSNTLKVLNITTLMTCEVEQSPDVAAMENFLADGVIKIYFRRILDTRIHSVEVYKMRGSEHSNKIHPFSITPKGIVVNPAEGIYGEF